MNKLLFSPSLFPPYHTFIHDNEDVAISVLLVFMGIYMYTFILFLHAQTILVLVFSPPYHMFIHDNEKNTINAYSKGS